MADLKFDKQADKDWEVVERLIDYYKENYPLYEIKEYTSNLDVYYISEIEHLMHETLSIENQKSRITPQHVIKCTNLTTQSIEWLYGPSIIDSILDLEDILEDMKSVNGDRKLAKVIQIANPSLILTITCLVSEDINEDGKYNILVTDILVPKHPGGSAIIEAYNYDEQIPDVRFIKKSTDISDNLNECLGTEYLFPIENHTKLFEICEMVKPNGESQRNGELVEVIVLPKILSESVLNVLQDTHNLLENRVNVTPEGYEIDEGMNCKEIKVVTLVPKTRIEY